MYNYQTQKHQLFNEMGMKSVMAVRDHVRKCLKLSEAVTMGAAMSAGCGGDSWTNMACVDYLVELGEIREIDYGKCAGQHRIFVPAHR